MRNQAPGVALPASSPEDLYGKQDKSPLSSPNLSLYIHQMGALLLKSPLKNIMEMNYNLYSGLWPWVNAKPYILILKASREAVKALHVMIPAPENLG